MGSKQANAKPAKKQASVTGFSPTPEDIKLIDDLRERFEPTLGKVSNSTLFRMGLRKLAEAEGLR